MATKKKEEPKKGKTAPKADDEKAAKRAARMAALKDRPEGQRPNSKQIDIITVGTGTIQVFANSLRKTGALVTAVTLDAKGNPISTSVTFVPGVKAKSKKGHGNLVPGVAGMGKKGKKGKNEEEEED